jgi:hypothetical protein
LVWFLKNEFHRSIMQFVTVFSSLNLFLLLSFIIQAPIVEVISLYQQPFLQRNKVVIIPMLYQNPIKSFKFELLTRCQKTLLFMLILSYLNIYVRTFQNDQNSTYLVSFQVDDHKLWLPWQL